MNKQQYVDSLRELADFIEKKPLPDKWRASRWDDKDATYRPPAVCLTAATKQVFGQLIAALGTFTKSSSSGYVSAIVTLPSGATVTADIDHEQICKRVVVGTKKVPFEQAYMRPAVPEHEEEVVEWKCPDSFVALKGEPDVIPK